MVDPPQFSHVGHHLIDKKGIGQFRKQFSCFNHVFAPTEPRFEVIDAERWPLASHRANQGLGDIDPTHGEIGTIINRPLLDAHEVFKPPILFRISQIELQLEA
jgi:hypothetical protein